MYYEVIEMDEFDYKSMIREKCKYFNMKEVCAAAGVNYSTYRGWKSNGHNLSDEKAKTLYCMMQSICNNPNE